MKKVSTVIAQCMCLVLAMSSCKDDILDWYSPAPADDVPASPSNIIDPAWIGTWKEVIDTNLIYFANSERRITLLENDSFNIEIYSFTDAIGEDSPCGYYWTNYAHGKVKDDDSLIDRASPYSDDAQLLLKGSFTDSSYTHRMPTCNGKEKYEQLFAASQTSGDTLEIIFYHWDDSVLYEEKINMVME